MPNNPIEEFLDFHFAKPVQLDPKGDIMKSIVDIPRVPEPPEEPMEKPKPLTRIQALRKIELLESDLVVVRHSRDTWRKRAENYEEKYREANDELNKNSSHSQKEIKKVIDRVLKANNLPPLDFSPTHNGSVFMSLLSNHLHNLIVTQDVQE